MHKITKRQVNVKNWERKAEEGQAASVLYIKTRGPLIIRVTVPDLIPKSESIYKGILAKWCCFACSYMHLWISSEKHRTSSKTAYSFLFFYYLYYHAAVKRLEDNSQSMLKKAYYKSTLLSTPKCLVFWIRWCHEKPGCCIYKHSLPGMSNLGKTQDGQRRMCE